MCSNSSQPLVRTSAVWAWPALMAVLILTPPLQGFEGGKPAALAEEKAAEQASDEQAIRAAVDSYVAAYNRGDAKAVAAHWSDSAEWISPSGERFEGREAIEKEMEALFAENKGVRIEVHGPVDSHRLA